MKKILIILFIASATSGFSQEKPKTVTTEFWVNGLCEMCKANIENAVDVKGVSYAIWEQETKILKVKFKTKKVSLQQLKENVAKAGYETKDVKANSEAYQKLPLCCKYNEK